MFAFLRFQVDTGEEISMNTSVILVEDKHALDKLSGTGLKSIVQAYLL